MHYIRPNLKLLAAILLACAIALTLHHQHTQLSKIGQALQDMDTRLEAMAEAHQSALAALTTQQEVQAAALRTEMDQLREEIRQELELPPLDIPLAANLQRHALYRCAQTGIAPVDLFAIMQHESGFDPDALGHNPGGTVDTGLMQINSVNWPWLAELGVDVHTPQGNIDAAVIILAQLQAKGYTREQVLAAYAAGEAGMLRGEGHWFPEELRRL